VLGEIVMKKGIAVAGNLIIDYYKEIDVYPEHSTLTTINQVRSATGGAVCNCAIDLAKIDGNLRITAIGVLGEDEAGTMILRELEKYPNIDTSQIIREGVTSYTDVYVDRTNHTRTFFQFRGANQILGIKHFDFKKINADILHIGYILLLDSLDKEDAEYGTVMARLLHQAKLSGLKTSIDVVSEQSERYKLLVPPALKYCDYCIINEIEGSRTTGIKIRDEKGRLIEGNGFKICQALLDMGVSEWAVIHMREGAVGISKDGEPVSLPSLYIPRESILSSTGAGDAFLSGTLYGAWKGNSLTKAIELGLATAAMSLLGANACDSVGSEAEARAFYEKTPKEKWIF
jgi:sugar/nucleoside kinase (ribokinase family)